MHYKSRSHEIAALKSRHKRSRYSVPFPDLAVTPVAECSNSFGERGAAVTWRRSQPVDAQYFPVGHCHKQGTQLITPDQIKNELQWMGGRKS